MSRLRKALMQTTIWLTAAASLMAGTPVVQCRCPGRAIQSGESAADPVCCCCGHEVDSEEGPPSCCQQAAALKDDPAEQAFRQESCRKEIVQPADATAERGSAECQQVQVSDLVMQDPIVGPGDVPAQIVSVDVPPVPPPVDRQLLLQHFVI